MSRVRFLFDEDFDGRVVRALRRMEPAIEIAAIAEIGRGGMSDESNLEFANAEGWLLASHDVQTLVGAAVARIGDGRGIFGLIVTGQKPAVRLVAEDLLAVWACSDPSEWRDRIERLPWPTPATARRG